MRITEFVTTRPQRPSTFFLWVVTGFVIGSALCAIHYMERHRPAFVEPVQTAPPTYAQVVDYAKKCTVLIETEDGYGSGIVLAQQLPDGHIINYVLTAGHVVASPDLVTAKADLETKGSMLSVPPVKITDYYGRHTTATVVAFSTNIGSQDFAVLRVDRPDWSKLRPVFNAQVPPVSTKVFYFGNFFGPNESFSYAEGYVSYRGRDRKFDQFNIDVAPGASGSALFNTDGQVIGIVVRSTGLHTAFTMPTRTLIPWLWAHGLQGVVQ